MQPNDITVNMFFEADEQVSAVVSFMHDGLLKYMLITGTYTPRGYDYFYTTPTNGVPCMHVGCGLHDDSYFHQWRTPYESEHTATDGRQASVFSAKASANPEFDLDLWFKPNSAPFSDAEWVRNVQANDRVYLDATEPCNISVVQRLAVAILDDM